MQQRAGKRIESVPPCGAYASVNGTKSRPSIIAFIASVSFAYLCRARQASASCQRGVAPTRGTNTHACCHGPIPAHTHALGRCFAGLSPTSADYSTRGVAQHSAYFLERRLMETTSSLHRMSRQRSAVSITCVLTVQQCTLIVATSGNVAVTQHAPHETRHHARPFNVTAWCECGCHEWDQPQHRLFGGNLSESMCQLIQCSTLECVP